jgi:hypothetical protein
MSNSGYQIWGVGVGVGRDILLGVLDQATENTVLNDQGNLEGCGIAGLLENLQVFRYSKKNGEVPRPDRLASTAIYSPNFNVVKW